ncbi:nuclear transport factor 2 family protein [Tenacibaculum sp. nBUS_03]|uniref:nuclear transport factor 2 family protein n=1 Tax=Tenacibaculum sp. nBUS_03 TaxID=3395320 RepID=UPI003EBE648B
MNPEKIVQNQLDAYNSRNLPDFLACYANDIKIYNFKEQIPYISGLKSLADAYKVVFDESPELCATIANRIVYDNKVIDQEQVTGRSGADFLEVVVIYEVENNLIVKVHFIRK